MKKLSIFVSISLASLIAIGCGGTATNVNVTANNSNVANTNSAAPAAVTSPTTPANANTNANANANANVAATPAKPPKGDASSVDGELQVGKTESVILYVGEESGDYAGYCFANDSDAGKKILAACKDGQQCEVSGTVDGTVRCKVPGLEADLSSSGRITSVKSAKGVGKVRR